MSSDPRYAEAIECTNADVSRQAINLLLETRAIPVLRAFVIDNDEAEFCVLATATRIHGRVLVFEMGIGACDVVLLNSLLGLYGQLTH